MFLDKFFGKNREEIDKRFLDKIEGVYSKEYLSILEKDFLKSRYALILIDIDDFEKVNTYYGKDVGDKLLFEVVKLMKISLRKEDVIVRVGGDEFIIFLKKDDNDKIIPYSIGEKIIQKIEIATFNINGNKIKITASAGLYLEAEKDANLSQAIEKTYKALSLAKQKGKNRIEVYRDSIVDRVNKKLIDIKEALSENRIISFYQPIFEIDSFKTVKFESLVRMITKDRKIVSPGMFLNQIVNTTVYKELTKKVIEYNIQVIKQKNIEVSINMLPSDLIDNDFINYLSNIPKQIISKITIELLESENIPDYNVLRNNISNLRALGYKIALDDFGSGYSNLTHVVELQFDYIKIDGNLIKKIDRDNVSYSVVKAIKGFASELNIDLVAEFISSKEIYDKIKEIGIKYGQGNYFKEAIPANLIK